MSTRIVRAFGRSVSVGSKELLFALIADGKTSWQTGQSSEQRARIFILGLIEAIPMAIGGIFSIGAQSSAQAVVAALVSLSATALLCWCFRSYTPPTRIEFARERIR